MNTIICWKESWGCHRSQTSKNRTEKRKKKRSHRRDRENTSVVFQIHVQFYMSPTQIKVIQRSLHFRKGKTNCFVPQGKDIIKTEKK